MAFVRALSAMPKVPLSRVMVLAGRGCATAVREVSSFLRLRTVLPESPVPEWRSGVRPAGGDDGDVVVFLPVALSRSPTFPRERDMRLVFEPPSGVFVRVGEGLIPMEEAGFILIVGVVGLAGVMVTFCDRRAGSIFAGVEGMIGLPVQSLPALKA